MVVVRQEDVYDEGQCRQDAAHLFQTVEVDVRLPPENVVVYTEIELSDLTHVMKAIVLMATKAVA